MACDAVLISINFWDGGYSEGWGLGGSWGGIKVRVRIAVEVRGLGKGQQDLGLGSLLRFTVMVKVGAARRNKDVGRHG